MNEPKFYALFDELVRYLEGGGMNNHKLDMLKQEYKVLKAHVKELEDELDHRVHNTPNGGLNLSEFE